VSLVVLAEAEMRSITPVPSGTIPRIRSHSATVPDYHQASPEAFRRQICSLNCRSAAHKRSPNVDRRRPMKSLQKLSIESPGGFRAAKRCTRIHIVSFLFALRTAVVRHSEFARKFAKREQHWKPLNLPEKKLSRIHLTPICPCDQIAFAPTL
jgi:hypothetical protein